jgi:hypothetical protein
MTVMTSSRLSGGTRAAQDVGIQGGGDTGSRCGSATPARRVRTGLSKEPTSRDALTGEPRSWPASIRGANRDESQER